MIPPVILRDVTIGNTQASASFGLSMIDEGAIMDILRDCYSDRILAILREYSSNAWDAHRSVGKHELPIKVTLPTTYEPALRIRDYGPGLSHDEMFTVYTQYGRSTKRTTDDAVGMLGIGSKSGFCYSDTFTITSWHAGDRRVYAAVLGDDEKGAINLLDTSPCDPSETGIEILIATAPGDRYDFEKTARRLFKHMDPRPEINIELPALPSERTVLVNGVITPGTDAGWIVVMGCVPYRLDITKLDARQISPALAHMSGQLTFPIGGVAMAPSREELKYTPATKTALVEKANALVDEFVTNALKTLESGMLDGWQTRLQVQVLAKLDLPLPDKWKPFAEGFAKVIYQPGDFTIIHNKSACTRLTVTAETRLLIDDTGNELSGYELTEDDYVVRCVGKTAEELRASLDAALVASGLVGVTIELLSTMYWTAPIVPVKRKSNPKHRARMFQLVKFSKGTKDSPWSNNWEPVLRVPTADDVYLVIEGFKPANDYTDFWQHHEEDTFLAKAFGVTMPTIYGYKSTEKRPVVSTPEGRTYNAWRQAFVKELLTPERITLVGAYWRAHPEGKTGRYSHDVQTPSKADLKWLTKQLGEDHLIVGLYVTSLEASKALGDNEQAIRTLALRNELTYAKSAMALATGVIRKRYPLLSRAGFRSLWHEGYSYNDEEKEAKNAERLEWVEYVQLRDARDEPARNNVVQLVSVP